MPIKTVAGKFQQKWGRYQYYWDTYENISVPMNMHCEIHGDFNLTPIEHYRRNPCPECQIVMWAKEALEKGWVTMSELVQKYNTTENGIIDTFARY